MRRTINAALLCALVGASACGGRQSQPAQYSIPEPVINEEAREATSGLECQVACAETPSREPVAVLRWSANKDARMKALSEQRLEATIYKDGFERGAFVAVQPSAKMEPKRFSPIGTGGRELPLALTRLHTAIPPRDESKLRFESTEQQPAVLVFGLEPGLNYFWRIAVSASTGNVASETVRCQAPVCPFDSDRETGAPND
jgi:hypothetical protein